MMPDGQGTGTAVTIVSGRRMIAEAVARCLTEHLGLTPDAVVTLDGETRRDVGSPRGLLVVDLDEPGKAWTEVIRIADQAGWQRRMGVFDAFDARSARAAFDLGITVLCPLSVAPAELVRMAVGEAVVRSVAADGITGDELERVTSLTPRELQVLRHLARGTATRVVAHVLGISTHTVHAHKRRLFVKLQVQSLGQAVALAAAAGAVHPDEVDETIV